MLGLHGNGGVFCVTGQVRFYGASFIGGKEDIGGESVRNIATRSAVFETTERTRRIELGGWLASYVLRLVTRSRDKPKNVCVGG